MVIFSCFTLTDVGLLSTYSEKLVQLKEIIKKIEIETMNKGLEPPEVNEEKA